LHPNVIEPQNRGFTPTEDEVIDAKRVLERYRALQRAGKVFEETDGRVIDVYEARRAEELLEWADLCAERNAEKADAVARTKAAQQR
jgi:citrate lyase beta subunit